MLITPVIPLSRRGFMVGSGAFAVAVSFGSVLGDAQAAPAAGFTPNAWVTVGHDNIVTIMFAQAEMGQGIMTGLPVLIAEEMDADWAKVRVVQSPSDPKIYGIDGKLGTFGSASTHDAFDRLRLVGAQVRRVLMMAAAVKWKVPLTELSTRPSIVVHGKTGRTISYGDLAKIAQIPDPLPAITQGDLKPAAQFRYIGKSLPRVDVPSKVNGTAIFGIDTQLPNMLYGAILRPPVPGEAPAKIDDRAVKSIPGIVTTKALPHGVAIIGETNEAVQKAKLALSVTWSNTAKARFYTSQAVLDDYRKAASDSKATIATLMKSGDVSVALAGAKRTLVRQYTADHVAHFCMEPMNATALVSGEAVDIWIGTQSPSNAIRMISEAAGIAPEKVTVHSMLLGGGFGRRFEGDVARDAYLVAREAPGRPVKVIWTREDDVHNDPYRPLVAQEIEIGFDDSGALGGWRHRVVGDSYTARTSPAVMERLKGFDPLVGYTGTPPYPVTASVMEYVRQDRGIDVGALRGISMGYTMFASECAIDEIAAELNRDPLEFRLSHLKDNPRAAKVIETAARMAKWTEKRPNRGIGIGYSNDLRSHVASVAEISLDEKTGEIHVHKVWCAADVGIAVQPRNVVAQLEGGIVFALGPALYEQLNITNGENTETNFGDYRVMRMSDIPEIEIELIVTDNPVGGVGEASVPPMAPAIANAFAQLTGGKRLRQLPMLPDRVKAALTV